MSAPPDPSIAAQLRAQRDSAIQAQDPGLKFRVMLRRAMHCGGLPARLDFALGGNAEGVLVGQGWGDPTPDGRWTLGPIAQLLVVTETPLAGALSLTIDFARASIAAGHPLQSVALGVNGVPLGERRFAHGTPFEPAWLVLVPAAVVERLGALLVDFRISSPVRGLEFGLDNDFRLLGVMVRAIRFAGGAPKTGGLQVSGV